MLYPEINKLTEIAGSRYFLISMAAKRARDIIDGCPKLDERITSSKPVSIATEEIAEQLFTYKTVEEQEAEAAQRAEAEAEAGNGGNDENSGDGDGTVSEDGFEDADVEGGFSTEHNSEESL